MMMFMRLTVQNEIKEGMNDVQCSSPNSFASRFGLNLAGLLL
jgi:hypothetical protein